MSNDKLLFYMPMSETTKADFNKRLIIAALLPLYLLIILISAWLCDDAFITLRTVDNFINGYGPVWNVSERVQSYTHPLWMFLLSAIYFITKEPYFTTIIISILLSLSAAYILSTRISVSAKNTFLVFTALIFSKAFIDYSTSGLENPLTHFLIVLFYFIYFKSEPDNKKIFFLSLTASLAALNRLDIILLLLPPLAYSAYKLKNLKSIPVIIAGFAPLILWMLFSLFYYGFPFPNTAYAKLYTSINSYEIAEQGLYYFINSLYLDPVTVPLIISGIILPFILKKKFLYPAALGVIFYLLYVVKIGGDFMSGRFFSSSVLISVILLSQVEIKKYLFAAGLVLIIFLGMMAPYPTILNSPTYGLGPKIVKGFRVGPRILITYDKGIADERLFYYQFTGLLNYKKLEEHQWVKMATEVRNSKKKTGVYNIAGIMGYYAGPSIHIVDPWALSDPLLSKLPATEYWRVGSSQQPGEKWWRIGHFTRKIPEGYIESIESKENKIENSSLKKYYDKLSLITKGDLWSNQRLTEIFYLNSGKYDYLIDEYSSSLK